MDVVLASSGLLPLRLPLPLPLPLLLLLLNALLVPLTVGYRDYQTAIPNGDRVPHPCADGQAWLGVGHVSPAGGGDRNPFGRDFAKYGLVSE